MSVYKELVGYLLPAGILEYFELSSVQQESGQLHIYLEEKDIIPEDYKEITYRSSGFMPDRKIRDFSIRDQLVTLHVKRRRWLLIESGEKVNRDYSIIAPGTSMTKDFAAFLKEITG
jgi:hypothetical protein